MKHNKLFTYSDKYDFEEYSNMCNFFSETKLTFIKNYKTEHLVSSYIFNYSMNRIPLGGRSTFRRLFGSLFDSSFSVKGNGKKCIVYTGGETKREDYFAQVKSISSCWENSTLLAYGFNGKRIKLFRLFDIWVVFIWALELNKHIHDYLTALDMANIIYRNFKTAKNIYRYVRKNGIEKLIVFCDAWGIDNIIVQRAKLDGIKTATLQHGNGTDIMYSIDSDFFIANSKLSYLNLVNCHMDPRRIFIAGPIKYLGKNYKYREYSPIRNIGIVFDGADNFENNVEMLDIVHCAIQGDYKFFIRLHPNNKAEDYNAHFVEQDIIDNDLEHFESNIDLCIVYNSSMYSDMIYRKIPTVRFKNNRIDLYPDVKDKGFSDFHELNELLTEIYNNYKLFISGQQKIYNQIFGEDCNSQSYVRFLSEVF
ncbi:MAG: hypothetical protein IJ706_05895 [Clostridia bacterium]|nr:hypothetical protein [Clostridia bacterium]